jgi:hypothetical protein
LARQIIAQGSNNHGSPPDPLAITFPQSIPVAEPDATPGTQVMNLSMAILVVAVIAGCVGARKGNRFAWPLLASVAVSTVLRIAETPFMPLAWMAIDLAVVLGMVLIWWFNIKQNLPPLRKRELAIIALFLPAWALYFWQPPWWVNAVELIVAAQLLASFPFRRAWNRVTPVLARLRRNDDGMMMAWG